MHDLYKLNLYVLALRAREVHILKVFQSLSLIHFPFPFDKVKNLKREVNI